MNLIVPRQAMFDCEKGPLAPRMRTTEVPCGPVAAFAEPENVASVEPTLWTLVVAL